MRTLLLVSILIGAQIIHALSAPVDSLQLLLQNAENEEKAVLYLDLLNACRGDSLQLLVEYGEQADFYAHSTMTDSLYTDFLGKIGVAYYRKSNYTLAENYFQKVLDIELNNDNPLAAAKMYSNIAVLNELRGSYNKAVEKYMQALEIFETADYKQGKSFVFNNLGVLYQEMGRKNESLSYYYKALELKQALQDSVGMASTLNNLGVVYEELAHQPDSALFFYKQASAMYRQLNEEVNYAISLENEGGILQQKKQYADALATYRQAVAIFKAQSNKQGEAWCYRNLGSLFSEMQRFAEAEEALLYGTQLAQETGEMKTLLEITGLLADLSYQTGNYQKAADYQKQYNTLNDSLLNTENQRQINELNTRYETSLLQYQNNLLSKENEIQKATLQRSKVLIFSVLFFFLFLGSILFFMYKHNKLRHLQRTIELEQKLLRAQVNPHFISNALGAIQGFILNSQPLEAADYLSDFSRLMRQTIKNSRENRIALSEEIESLRDYLKIQQLRFGNLFDFQIEIDDAIEAGEVQIPPMLVQPFVENAIKHGFKTIDHKGHLLLLFEKQDNLLKITVRDNGVGLKTQQKNNEKHISYSLKITRERLQNLKKTTQRNATVTLRDLSEKNAKGTEVELIIPLINTNTKLQPSR